MGGESSTGMVSLRPAWPSIGLSTSALNRDHDEVDYAGTPAGPPARNVKGQTITIDRGWRSR